MRSVSGFVEVSPTHGFGRRGCNTARISQVSRVGCQTIAQGFPLSRPLFLSVVTVITSVGPTRLQCFDSTTTVSRFVVLSSRFLVLSYLHGRSVNDSVPKAFLIVSLSLRSKWQRDV